VIPSMIRGGITMKLSWLLIAIVALCLPALCLLAGCGDGGSDGTPEDTTPPTVLGSTPAEGATDVSPYPVIQVLFSEAMDSASIDTLTFHIDGVRAYLVAYDAAEHKATLYPAGLLQPGTAYTAHVDTAVTDASGNAMEQEVAVHFTTGPLDCDHLQDRFEPNDDIASATPVEPSALYPGLTSCGGAERTDYYRFTLAEARKINVSTISAYADTARVDWKIHFHRADGQEYATLGTSMRAAGGTESFDYSFLPGTYWVEIGKYYSDSHLVLYHLKMESLDPVPDDEFEDNDFPDEARPIEPGLHEGLRGAFVDADYFSIDLTAGQTITVTATEVTSTGTSYRLVVTNAAGGTYTGHDGQDAHATPAVESWMATQTGKHLILIMWWADNVVYNLNVEVSG
jgi:hypothetical protein